MRTLTISLLLSIAAGCLFAQRPKPVVDPETKDGLLIEHIQQESDQAEKLRYMEQFVAQYPNHPAAAWVFDQLQPIYFSMKEWDQAMHIGKLRLAVEPENLEAGKIALRSAEAKHDQEEIAQWADRVWKIASAVSTKGGALAAEARDTENYAEFCLFNAAQQTADPHSRLELLKIVDQHGVTAEYTQKLSIEYLRVYRELGPEDKAREAAERVVQDNPENVDALLFLAEFYFHKDAAHDREKALNYALKVVEAIDRKSRSDSADADWAAKKTQLLGTANYIGGVSSSQMGNWVKADVMLRAALPTVKEQGVEAMVLYHLGMANYRLADKGGPSRSMAALQYMRRCAAIRSPFQEQAIRNVEGIKAEFNLK